MIVVMKADATAEQIEHMVAHITSLGLTPQVIKGTHQTVIAAIGEERPGLTEALEPGEGVEKVLPIMAPYKRASSELKAERTVVKARGLEVGGSRVAVIAGPCSVESEDADHRPGDEAQGTGGHGVARRCVQAEDEPLQLPGAQGRGPQDARRRPRGDGPGDRHRGDGSRTRRRWSPSTPTCFRSAPATCRTTSCLQAVGDSGKPALLKRGMSATVDEFLLAAEYILDRGNPNVMLCERGIRTYEDHTRFTLPLATVPYLHDKSHLPVVVDPSHGTGKARLVAPMCKAAIAAGADALIVEVHDDPEHAVSDGSQTITPAAFAQMMAHVPPDRRGRRSDALSHKAAAAIRFP